MTLRCIVVEDNAVERDLMEVLLRKVDGAEIVGVFENGLQALQFLQQHPDVDIAFTDIDMPELSGIGLLKSLRQPPAFVFISAHGKYAADGYDLDVVDFIKKPVTPERLFRAFGKVKEHLENRPGTPQNSSDEILIARTSEGLHKLATAEIAYAESKANYSVLHLLDGSTVMVLVGLKQLEEQLPADRFIRIHKAYLINWNHAGLIGKDHVLVAGKHEVPIGDSHRKELAERIAGHRALKR